MEIEIDTKNNRVRVFNIGTNESGNHNHTGKTGMMGGSDKKNQQTLISDKRKYDMRHGQGATEKRNEEIRKQQKQGGTNDTKSIEKTDKSAVKKESRKDNQKDNKQETQKETKQDNEAKLKEFLKGEIEEFDIDEIEKEMSNKDLIQSCLDIIDAESGELNVKSQWEQILEEQGLGEIKDYSDYDEQDNFEKYSRQERYEDSEDYGGIADIDNSVKINNHQAKTFTKSLKTIFNNFNIQWSKK